MRTYPEESWRRLGDWVERARLRAGYALMKDWAKAVGRSQRQLSDLKRGRPVGPQTLAAIATALKVTEAEIYEQLEGDQRDDAGQPDGLAALAEAGPRLNNHERQLDVMAARIDELEARLAAVEGRLDYAWSDVEARYQPGANVQLRDDASVTGLPSSVDPEQLDLTQGRKAARTTKDGKPTPGQQRRRVLDSNGEESQERPDGEDPA